MTDARKISNSQEETNPPTKVFLKKKTLNKQKLNEMLTTLFQSSKIENALFPGQEGMTIL